MKLYTEEQIKEIYRVGIIDGKCGADINNIDYSMFDGLTSIELPSDDEIEKECNKLPFEKHVDAGMYNDGQIDGFELGAKWMKEQILNQDK